MLTNLFPLIIFESERSEGAIDFTKMRVCFFSFCVFCYVKLLGNYSDLQLKTLYSVENVISFLHYYYFFFYQNFNSTKVMPKRQKKKH